jgi:hypothetical protein
MHRSKRASILFIYAYLSLIFVSIGNTTFNIKEVLGIQPIQAVAG